MLEPQSRRLLMEALAPPPGYRFDRAVGTTFTLDLLALLTAPLAFSLLEVTGTDGGHPAADPLALLEAARRHASHITIFADAGHVAVPTAGQPLFALLEESVVPVAAPRAGGLFHPKVWVVRYTSADAAPHLRFLCSSRNLTFDRSWDTLLVLDGQPSGKAVSASTPIARFVEALPSLALAPVRQEIADTIVLLAGELRITRFEPPPGVEDVIFHPMGLNGPASSPLSGRIDRLLVVSPFVSDAKLRELATHRGARVLLSRPEELARVDPDVLGAYDEVLVMSDAAVGENADREADGGAEPLSPGLHAKLYVADAGWNARVWTGSANATDQAFRQNVEMVVELQGKKSVLGIAAVLDAGARGVPGMRDLLQEYPLHSSPIAPDADDDSRRKLLDDARVAISRAPLVARVQSDNASGLYDLHLLHRGQPQELPDGVMARCRPISIGTGQSVVLRMESTTAAAFLGLDIRALSAFFAISLFLDGAEERAESFSIAVPLEGAPDDRGSMILASILRDRRDFIRFLLLLLASDESAPSERLADLRRVLGGGSESSAPTDDMALLEPLLRALAHDPARVDQIARVIEELEATPEGRERLPEDLMSIWPAIWSTRQEATRP